METSERSIFDILSTPLPQPSKRDLILAAACLVFIDKGYEGTSMELIANQAGVARRTLYNQFPDGKLSIFRAVLSRMWQSFPSLEMADNELALTQPEQALQCIGRKVAKFWAPPMAIAFLRMVIGESSRFPEIMDSFYELKARPVTAVADYIRELGKRGVLQLPDPELAVQHFISLISENVIWKRVMGNESPVPEEQLNYFIEQAVAVFLSHYRATAYKSNASLTKEDN